MIGLGLVLLASISTQPASDDPLLPALSGRLQCYTPDEARKTCSALAGYRPDGEGRYQNRAELPLDPGGTMTLTTNSPVRVVSGAVCGTARAEDVTGGELKLNGTPVAADRAAPVLANIAQALTSLIGHEICTRYEPRANGFAAEISMDGARRPDLDRRVIWVGSSDGYRVVGQ